MNLIDRSTARTRTTAPGARRHPTHPSACSSYYVITRRTRTAQNCALSAASAPVSPRADVRSRRRCGAQRTWHCHVRNPTAAAATNSATNLTPARNLRVCCRQNEPPGVLATATCHWYHNCIANNALRRTCELGVRPSEVTGRDRSSAAHFSRGRTSGFAAGNRNVRPIAPARSN